jgi:hypothetical protein
VDDLFDVGFIPRVVGVGCLTGATFETEICLLFVAIREINYNINITIH